MKKFEKRDISQKQKYWWIRSIGLDHNINGVFHNDEEEIERISFDTKVFSISSCFEL